MIMLGKLTINEHMDELGHEVKVEIEQIDEDFESTNIVGLVTLNIFDERDEHLFIQADAHSQWICNLVENVHIAPPYSEEWDKAMNFKTLHRSERATYMDGSNHSVVSVAGKLAILSELNLKVADFDFVIMKEIIELLIKKIDSLFNINFLLTNKEFYIPDVQIPHPNPTTEGEELENLNRLKPIFKENINFLKQTGFKKTGLDGYVLKVNEYEYQVN